MKIGIMTFHASYNCGSMIQAYALQQTLIRKFNADVEIIDYSNWNQRNMYGLYDLRLKKSAIKNNIQVFGKTKYIRESRVFFEKFMDENMVLSPKRLNKHSELSSVADRYDLIIAGGDQVWNIRCRDHDDAYFLDFVEDVKKVAYSPSLGANDINKWAENPQKYASLLNKFEMLSVREGNGKKWLDKLTGKDVPIVADPVLLLTKDEWNTWLSLPTIDEKYIFDYSYYYNKADTNEAVKEVSEKTGLPVYTIDYKPWATCKLEDYGIHRYGQAGPIAMLTMIKNAELVLTQSFHGTLVSALFNKKFWYYDNRTVINDDDRATFLLGQLGLSSRYVLSRDLSKLENLMDPIDYTDTNSRISEMRNQGFEYIKEHIIN